MRLFTHLLRVIALLFYVVPLLYVSNDIGVRKGIIVLISMTIGFSIFMWANKRNITK